MWTKKNKLFVLLSASVVLVTVGTVVNWDVLTGGGGGSIVRYEISHDGFLVNTPGCVIPDLDPFDTSVLKLYASQAALRCKGPPPLVAVDYGTGELRLDPAVASAHYRENPASIKCSYRAIRRDPEGRSDKDIVVDKRGQRLGPGQPVIVRDEFVYIQCLNHWGKEIYSDYAPFVHRKPEVEQRVAEAGAGAGGGGGGGGQDGGRLSIVLVGIDSISRLNFIRHFPNTRRFLVEDMNALQLLGYTKVGDNTYPNIVPMLSGMDVQELPKGLEGNKAKPFDDVPFIWKNFSASGYRTLYAEEIPTISAFNYLKAGFHRQPTDYYYRPFTLATEPSSMRRRSGEHCFNSRMEVDALLRWLRGFLTEFRGDATFSLAFASRLTHDRLNAAGWADRPYHDFLRSSHSLGLFNRSVLFFFSDHGIRFGAIRDTYVGKLEERLPFAFLAFPDWFRERFPRAWTNLERNQRRLTTPFDIHATLLDLMRLDGDGGGDDGDGDAVPAATTHTTTATAYDSDGNNGTGTRALSLLGPVPEDRTCVDAGILPHWCVCHERQPGDASSPVVRAASGAIVDAINRKLAPVGRECAALALRELMDVRVGVLGRDVMDFKRDKTKAPVSAFIDYLLTVKVAPGDGVFEGTVRYKEAARQFTVMEPISRISEYGEQSSCVNSTELRRFCYCVRPSRA